MRVCERIVADTNCLVSRLLLPSSVPGDAAREAIDSGLLLVSEATMNELADVLGRRKFDHYITIADRLQFLRLLGRVAEYVPTVYPVRECRDPKDDKFLEVTRTEYSNPRNRVSWVADWVAPAASCAACRVLRD